MVEINRNFFFYFLVLYSVLARCIFGSADSFGLFVCLYWFMNREKKTAGFVLMDFVLMRGGGKRAFSS
jgi:hypothetical protein